MTTLCIDFLINGIQGTAKPNHGRIYLYYYKLQVYKVTVTSLHSEMPLERVSSIILLSDSFWETSTLDVLRMLMSTSKGFHAELNTTTSSGMVEHALLAMIKNRPSGFNRWMLRFSDASYHFSLQMDEMITYCAALPLENRSHVPNGTSTKKMRIFFIDAYRLAVSNGMKGAMERRHQFDMKVEESANKLMEKFGFDLFTTMESKIDDGIRKLLHGSSRCEIDTLPKIHSLTTLLTDINDFIFGLFRLLPSKRKKPDVAEAFVRDLNDKAMAIVACYRTRSVFCPDAMPLDFISEI